MNKNLTKYFMEYLDYPITLVNCKILELVSEYFDKIPDYFYRIPASSTGKYHPRFDNGDGGLVRHTQMVCDVMRDLQRLNDYKCLGHFDMMIACILHDTFKNGYTDNGYTVESHANIAADEFYSTYIKHKYQNEELSEISHGVLYDYTGELYKRVNNICNMIRTHGGQWSQIQPSSDSEKLVHLADYIASRKCWDKFNDK